MKISKNWGKLTRYNFLGETLTANNVCYRHQNWLSSLLLYQRTVISTIKKSGWYFRVWKYNFCFRFTFHFFTFWFCFEQTLRWNERSCFSDLLWDHLLIPIVKYSIQQCNVLRCKYISIDNQIMNHEKDIEFSSHKKERFFSIESFWIDLQAA